ncbi:unnamed protein product [Phyllotreta striolata]|uniref:Peptidoglycan-recognition protein n=1 Tax=Phyllotreta striolata TaxID=444603 RepID=A0A9N9TMZ6_PHYSR|nr:unnamed protein product [Phyllotreta striolata]
MTEPAKPHDGFQIQFSYTNKDTYWKRSITCPTARQLIILLILLSTAGLLGFAIKVYLDSTQDEPILITRFDWLAQPPATPVSTIKTPLALVIIHHTATSPCDSKPQCILATRNIQEYHIASKGWSDIGYNFLIGGDGRAYEGRGWTGCGAHTIGYNNRSLGVGFIGTFTVDQPAENQLRAFDRLTKMGVESGYLVEDFTIFSASQLSGTKSPGEAFADVIKTWSRWNNYSIATN